MAQYSTVNTVDTPYTTSSADYNTTFSSKIAKEPRHSSFSFDNDSQVHSNFALKEWLWEFLAWFVGVLFIVAAVVLLIKLDQAPTKDWPLRIQPSTVLTALAYVVQSSLL